jgi:hypothetical protein
MELLLVRKMLLGAKHARELCLEGSFVPVEVALGDRLSGSVRGTPANLLAYQGPWTT